MYNIFLLFLLVVVLLILTKLNIYENFTQKQVKYIFDTDIFDNKTVFLIANNRKISDETLEFINNYDYKDSVIVRFNGLKPVVKKYCKGKTDVMIYRSSKKSFHGLRQHNKNFINVYTYNTKKLQNDLLNLENVIPDKIRNRKDNPLYIMPTEEYIFKNNKNKVKTYKYTTGFQTLLSLLKSNKFKKIYLIGFTFHGAKVKNRVHNDKYEHEYFYDKLEKNNKIEILL